MEGGDALGVLERRTAEDQTLAQLRREARCLAQVGILLLSTPAIHSGYVMGSQSGTLLCSRASD
jgi:hypothetical protein